MAEKIILIIHPKDRTTIFLDKIKNHLIGCFNEQIHHFNIYPNKQSHLDCLDRVSIHPRNGIIIFLGHGRSDKLFGSKGKLYPIKDSVSQDAIAENPDAYFYDDNFITENNIEVFSGKKIFCLACNSNSRLAEFAHDKGARCFFGFGDIPTSLCEFEDKEEKVSKDVVTKMKAELNYIIKTGLSLSISKGLTFEELLNYIHFITNQRIADILINQKHFKERHLLVDHLYLLKKEAMVIGNKRLKLIE